MIAGFCFYIKILLYSPDYNKIGRNPVRNLHQNAAAFH